MQNGHEPQMRAAQKMRAYIDAHLQEAITAADVAKSAGYSPFYAARLFKEAYGLAPFEYIRRERLVRSAHALRGGKPKVLTIALEYVFDSHEGFTRAFANAFGITPKKYAMLPPPNGWILPFRYLDRKNKKEEEPCMKEEAAVLFTQIVERPLRKLILRRSRQAEDYFSYCEEVGCGENNASAPWDILCGIKEALYEPVGLWLPENMRPADTGVYAHGVEVPFDYAGEIPPGFDVIPLAPCKMLVFQGEAYDDADFEEEVGLCMERIEKFNPQVYGYQYADQLAPRMQLSPMGWRGYIEMRPVRRMDEA